MPITGIRGKGGSGKTTIATWLLAKYFQDIKKYVNFNLTLPNTEKIDSIELFDIDDEGKPVIVVWDEGYTEMDNRDAMDEKNKINSYLLFQARKNNMSIISITQLNIMDIRWRELEENSIICFDRPIYTRDFKPYKGIFKYAYVMNNRVSKFTLSYKEAEKVFPYFKTKQKILPKNFEEMRRKVRLQNNPKEILAYVDEIANNIKANCDIEKVTHDEVKRCMLEREYMDFKYEPYVYIKLKGKI